MNATTLPIVLLEDDATLRALLADGLRHAGFTVLETATGPLAWAALEGLEGRAILVADRSVDTSGANGFQLAADALERYAALRAVYVTGTHIALRRRPLGERERALMKPFAMTQLLAAVRELSRLP